jgi:hypothetical protein
MRSAAKAKPAGIVLTVERNFLVATSVVSGNGCCKVLDHPAIRDCQLDIISCRIPDALADQAIPGGHRGVEGIAADSVLGGSLIPAANRPRCLISVWAAARHRLCHKTKATGAKPQPRTLSLLRRRWPDWWGCRCAFVHGRLFFWIAFIIY